MSDTVLIQQAPEVIVRIVQGVELTLDHRGPQIFARVESSGCWHWLRYIAPDGYGRIGRNRQAHRVVYEALVAPIPRGLA